MYTPLELSVWSCLYFHYLFVHGFVASLNMFFILNSIIKVCTCMHVYLRNVWYMSCVHVDCKRIHIVVVKLYNTSANYMQF